MLLKGVTGTNTYIQDTTYDSAGRMNIRTFGNGTQSAYGYYACNQQHAVASAGGNSYLHDANGSQITRSIGSDTFTLSYDAENRLAEVKKNNVSMATFVYDGDGKMVKAVMNGTNTTLYVGAHYQVTNGVVTKYYPGGAFRVGGVLYYALGDHLGSTSITTDSSGALVAEMRYKPWGEVRYNSGTTPTDRTYTGQRSYTADFGLMFYNARWYDSSLGRFAQADTVVPGGVQGYDRYAYTGNNPINYTDPTGHNACDNIPDGASKDACNNTGYGAEEREKDLQARLLKDYQTGTGCGGATGDLCALGNLGPNYKPASPEVQLALALVVIGIAYLPIAIIVVPGVIAAVASVGAEQCATNDTCQQEAVQTAQTIYRSASGTPDSLTPRLVKDVLEPLTEGKTPGMSFWNNIDKLNSGKYIAVDVTKIKNLSVVFDNNPEGHVTLTTSLEQLTEWANTRGSTVLIESAHWLTQEIYNAGQILTK